jgi:rubrerythrin
MKQKTSAGKKGGKTEKEMSGKTAWRCKKCGQIHYSDEAPDECPYCLFPNKPFEEVETRE